MREKVLMGVSPLEAECLNSVVKTDIYRYILYHFFYSRYNLLAASFNKQFKQKLSFLVEKFAEIKALTLPLHLSCLHYVIWQLKLEKRKPFMDIIKDDIRSCLNNICT